MKSNYYAVLMAGGVGSRFWPVSTQSFPKQFHDMLGSGKTLIQSTFDRLSKLIPTSNIFILTNERYDELVHEQLDGLDKRQVVLEPAMRNTAPCILFAALKIAKEDPDGVMIVAPSDHWIEDEQSFLKNVEAAFSFASANDALLTLGIRPTFPNTGYGYIEYDTGGQGKIKAVTRFMEKPDYETARKFLAAGNFLWNAGIFIWSVKSIIKAFEDHQPEMYRLFEEGLDVYNTDFEDDFVNQHYAKADNISVDYAIMERSENVFVLPAEFGWNDLGTWGSLYEKLDKDEFQNAGVNAKLLSSESWGNMIRTKDEKIVVIDGLENYIIVDEEKALLIYPKSKEQDIKLVLQQVKDKFGKNYG